MTPAAVRVAALRGEIESLLAGLLEPGRPFALIDFPNYPNVGDNAIYLGQIACLRGLGRGRPTFVCDFASYDAGALARAVGDGPILLTGGGSFGDVWPTGQACREAILEGFPRNRIIQLPQTLHFDSADALRRARRVVNAHPDFTILVRDRRSLEIARNEFTAPARLCSDMAFCLGPLARTSDPSLPLVWLARTDKEARIRVPDSAPGVRLDWLAEGWLLLRELSYRLIGATRRKWLAPLARPLLVATYEPLAWQRLRRGIDMLCSAEVVVTDRLHGHILCVLLGIPHVVLDNSYGKLSSFVASWTGDVDGVHRADSAEEAIEIAAALGHTRTVNAVRRRGLAEVAGEAHDPPARSGPRMRESDARGEPITYLIASHDCAPYLMDCLRSLRDQTDPAWLALICDDASTDESLDIIRGCTDDRITTLVNHARLGYIGTLERLLAHATTDIVAILDADDALTPEATSRLRDVYAAQEDAGFVYSRFAHYDPTLTHCRGVHGSPVAGGGAALRQGVVGAIRSFRRSIYEQTGGLDETMLYAEDRDLVYKLEEVTRPVFIDAVLYRYRELPHSQSRDPLKREVGARNTRRARQAAIRRRNVRGVRRVLCELLFLADYLDYSGRYPPPVRRLARAVGSLSERLIRMRAADTGS